MQPKDDLFNEKEIQDWFEDEDNDSSAANETPSPESIVDKYAKSQLRVIRETKDYTLDYLQHALKQGQYIISVAPDYQRRQRWSIKKRSQLIESFLMNIPVPPVFLFEKDYNEYEVVDGRQRMEAIREFLSNGFALVGLEYWGELNRKRFNQLPPIIQKGLLRRSLSAIVLLTETKSPAEDDFDVRTVLFNRLNTGGEKLNPQELRNALYPGEFNKILITLARSDEFTNVWGIPRWTPDEKDRIPEALADNTLYKTMADCELVLRFYAIREMITQNLSGSLRRLLDSTMQRHYRDTAESAEGLKASFLSLLRQLTVLFDGIPFVLPNTSRPSRPLYDALMVALSLQNGKDFTADKSAIQARFSNVAGKSDDYEVLVGRGNTIDAIKQRVQLATWILKGDLAHE